MSDGQPGSAGAALSGARGRPLRARSRIRAAIRGLESVGTLLIDRFTEQHVKGARRGTSRRMPASVSVLARIAPSRLTPRINAGYAAYPR